ncbi:MAG: hypothetical protein SH868_20070 [Bythopirellula sp.]|nr:hypothetical protein [Bythopirellula sp.]
MIASFFRLSLLGPTVILMVFACVGCQPQEEISTYSVERTRPPRAPFVAAEVADELDRTLAAMLPLGEQVYFFKLVGKAPAVGRHREEFDAFLTGVSKGDTEEQPLAWKLPEGWTEKGPSEMRLNTVVIPDAGVSGRGGALEIAVSSLPMSGAWEDFVAMNVNRWLKQLSQGELPRQTILNLTKELKTAAGPATVIELAGVMQDTMPMNPHGGTTAQSPPATPAPVPSETAPAAAPQTNAEFTFDTPANWQPGRVSAMRKAAFMVVDEESQAEFTVIDLPSSGGAQITDVMANVQRWAAQVGLPIDDKLAELEEEIDIDGTKGSFVNLVGPESTNPRQAMLAAMVVREEKVWFFKLFGAAALVERETENFRKFVDSVKFK